MLAAWQDAWSSAQIVMGAVGRREEKAICRRLVSDGLPEPVRVPELRELLEFCLWRSPDLVIVELDRRDRKLDPLLRELRDEFLGRDHVPLLALVRDGTRESRRRFQSLGVRDFLTAPIDGDELALRVRNHLESRFLYRGLLSHSLELMERMRLRTREIELSQREVVDHLARAVQCRDDDTGDHNARVADLSARLADELGLSASFIVLIWRAAPLHDVGKIGTPDAILLKPGKLTSEEMTTMRLHTQIGGGILEGSASRCIQLAEVIARTHHEWWDGSGYWGLEGEDIPLEGRIVAVADVFDALTHARVYKAAWTEERAIQHMVALREKQFDPAVLDALLRVLKRPQA